MSKTAKKLLSVVLAVLVLAAGFSTTLGAFRPVLADQVTVYDYTTFDSKLDSVAFDDNLGNSFGGQYTGYAQFGINTMNGIRIESTEAAKAGLKVSDTFFTKRQIFTSGLLGGHDADDYKAYMTYAVEPGTAFIVEYIEYDEGAYAGLNINGVGKVYDNLELLVSADGVNWVPANASYNTKADNIVSYDSYVATIANVGAKTRYVKVQFPQHVNDVTSVYVPQDAFVVQKIHCTVGTGLNDGEVKLATTNADQSWTSAFFAYDGIAEAVGNGECIAAGYSALSWNDVYNKEWGAVAEVNRSMLMRAEPGTRLSVKVQVSEHYLSRVREALKTWSADKLANVDDIDCEFKVYTSMGDGKWTEHRYSPSNITANGSELSSSYKYKEKKIDGNIGASSYTIDLILPENHSYVKIVFPWEGDPNKVAFYDEDGNVKKLADPNGESDPIDLVAGDGSGRGNQTVFVQEVIYTPYANQNGKEVNYPYSDVNTYPYGTGYDVYVNSETQLSKNESGTPYTAADMATNPSVYKFFPALLYNAVPGGAQFNALTSTVTSNQVGLDNYAAYDNDNKRGNGPNPFGITIGYTAFGTPSRDSTRVVGTEARPYVIYEVEPGTVFNAEFYVNKDTKNNAESAATNQNGDGTVKKPFEFYISVSDSVNGTYENLYKTNTTVTVNQLAAVVIPEGKTFVKIEFPQSGLINGNPQNHSARLLKVSYVPAVREEVTYNYREIGTATSVKYSDSTFKEKTGIYATNTAPGTNLGIVLHEAWPNDNFTGGIYYDVNGTATSNANAYENGYVIYNVEPGSTFTVNVGVNAQRTSTYASYSGEPCEFVVYTSASANSGYSEIRRTNTTVTSGNCYTTITFDVPENAAFVKVEFPHSCVLTDSSGGGHVWSNHMAMLYDVTYVPYKAKELFYDYKLISKDYLSNANANKENQLKYTDANFNSVVGAVDAKYVIVDGWTANDALGIWADATGMPNGTETFRSEYSYITYKAKPGTRFQATVGLANDHYTKHPGETADSFKFRVYASDAVDGEYVELASTGTLTDINVTVPEGKPYIKITFPQRNLNSSAGDYGNHCAFLRYLYVTPFVEDEEEEVVVDNGIDYAKGEVALSNANKADYAIYNFAGVKGTANGLVADEAGAFVTYKVGNGFALKVTSNDALKFAVSYDGVNFTKAQLFAYAGAYTVNVLEGKQYVKVYLDEGETITAAAVDALKPTATFINYTGKAVSFDVVEGTTPVAPAIAKRTGYTFDSWTGLGAIYVDTTYIAKYNKDATKTFTVALKAGSGSIVYPEGITETTVRFDDRITITAAAAPEGKVFDKWVDENGKVVSNSSKFSFLASGNLTLEAVYAETKSDFAPFIYNSAVATVNDNENGSWNMSVIWRVNAPANTNITETGIFFAATNLGDGANWVNDGVKLAHTTTAANKTLMYTVTNIKAAKDARYAIPYAVIGGEYVFGNVVSAVAEEIEEEVVIKYDLTPNYKTEEFGGNVGPWGPWTTSGIIKSSYGSKQVCKGTYGLTAGYGDIISQNWDDDFYLVYDVTPGTKFEATVIIIDNNKRASWKDQKDVEFEFEISASADMDNSYGNVITTAGMTGTYVADHGGATLEEIVITYDVPADCEYVKVRLPQRGILPDTDARLNDFAYLAGVKLNGTVAQ